MPYFEKTISGKWKVTAKVNKKRCTKTVRTKAEGNAWAANLHVTSNQKIIPRKTFGELLEHYRDIVSVKKKGERWERIRIEKFLKDSITHIQIADLKKNDFAEWRDKRLLEVSNLSVLREWALLNHALEISVSEWEWLSVNPMKGLKKPSKPPARDRLISQDEIDRLCHALGYAKDVVLKTVTSRVGAGFMFAIETALRDKEICQLEWRDIKSNILKVVDSKTPTGIREVPLSKRALEIIEQCEGVDEKLVFGINTRQRDALFRKAKKMAGITKEDNLHFHDSRAEAITRLAKKLDILDLARMIGHKDLSMLMVYYRKKASDIAPSLD